MNEGDGYNNLLSSSMADDAHTDLLDGISIVCPPLITLTGPNLGHAPPLPRLISRIHL